MSARIITKTNYDDFLVVNWIWIAVAVDAVVATFNSSVDFNMRKRF